MIIKTEISCNNSLRNYMGEELKHWLLQAIFYLKIELFIFHVLVSKNSALHFYSAGDRVDNAFNTKVVVRVEWSVMPIYTLCPSFAEGKKIPPRIPQAPEIWDLIIDTEIRVRNLETSGYFWTGRELVIWFVI